MVEDVRSEVRDVVGLPKFPPAASVYLRAKDLGCLKYLGEQLKTLLTATSLTGRKATCQANTPLRSPSKKFVSCSVRPLNTVLRPGFPPAFASRDLSN